MPAVPCTTRLDIYDALFDDAPAEQQAAAHPIAVQLCGSCPARCDQAVTAASAPRAVEELPEAWLPPTRDGRTEFTGQEPWHGRPYSVTAYGCTCQRCANAHVPNAPRRAPRTYWPKSTAYVPPANRISTAAKEAGQLAAKGLTVQQIADHLYVTLPTAEALLRLADTASKHAA